MNDIESSPSEPSTLHPKLRDVHTPARRSVLVPLAIAGLVTVIIGLGGWLLTRASAHTNRVALIAQPKGVTATTARAARYRPLARYVGSIEPWIEAKLGPQFTSAYVDTVLVRPGALVRRNQVVATLDCRDASAASKAVAMQARALETQQEALAHQAARVGGLLNGGYVSADEVEQRSAESLSKQAELLATQAKLLRASLEVGDCILRAPFDGEVAERSMDPGAFARPGSALVTVVDRSTVRITADVPESDFMAVPPGTQVQIHLLATGERLQGQIARRSPTAEVSTRTVRFEIDLADPERKIPVHTTADLIVAIGDAVDATEIPLTAAAVRGEKATVFVVENGVTHKRVVPIVGEGEGELYVDPALAVGTYVITQGRATVQDGDRVAMTVESATSRAVTAGVKAQPPGDKAEGRM
jgi:RND family efflux transporter MFP subunit